MLKKYNMHGEDMAGRPLCPPRESIESNKQRACEPASFACPLWTAYDVLSVTLFSPVLGFKNSVPLLRILLKLNICVIEFAIAS